MELVAGARDKGRAGRLATQLARSCTHRLHGRSEMVTPSAGRWGDTMWGVMWSD